MAFIYSVHRAPRADRRDDRLPMTAAITHSAAQDDFAQNKSTENDDHYAVPIIFHSASAKRLEIEIQFESRAFTRHAQ